jgi:hypothetical protein
VRYESGPVTAILDRMPFVGRVTELERLGGDWPRRSPAGAG